MLDFITLLSVVALVFCTATVLIALIASVLLTVGRVFRKKRTEGFIEEISSLE